MEMVSDDSLFADWGRLLYMSAFVGRLHRVCNFDGIMCDSGDGISGFWMERTSDIPFTDWAQSVVCYHIGWDSVSDT